MDHEQHLPSRVDDLLSALRTARASYLSGQTCSLTWIKERRMIVAEAERLGVTDELLERMDDPNW